MPNIWSIADLHLSFGVPNKAMDIFGPQWIDHARTIEKNWHEKIHEDDLVLIPGDISWAMRIDEVVPDLEWIGNLPGTKLLLRGNHDYWWESLTKIKQILPPSCHLIQNNSYIWQDIGIGGARLWDSTEYQFGKYIDYQKNSATKPLTEEDHSSQAEKIFLRELGRLEISLKSINPRIKKRIIMTHYPPIGADLHDSIVSGMLEKYGVNICVFGHLHNVKKGLELFGEHHGIHYALTSADYLNFSPLKIL